jgi:hypothetical protein
MQLSVNPHPGHPTVTSHTRQANNRNTHGNVTNERAHRPNRTRTRPHTASAERRHSFAVTTLVNCYRCGTDPQATLPVLSAYLGHAEPAYTYWYYSDSRVIPMPAPSCA